MGVHNSVLAGDTPSCPGWVPLSQDLGTTKEMNWDQRPEKEPGSGEMWTDPQCS